MFSLALRLYKACNIRVTSLQTIDFNLSVFKGEIQALLENLVYCLNEKGSLQVTILKHYTRNSVLEKYMCVCALVSGDRLWNVEVKSQPDVPDTLTNRAGQRGLGGLRCHLNNRTGCVFRCVPRSDLHLCWAAVTVSIFPNSPGKSIISDSRIQELVLLIMSLGFTFCCRIFEH